MEYLELIAVPAIVSIIVGLLKLIKNAVDGNQKVLKFFPLIAVVLGAVLGVVTFYAFPEIIPASSLGIALKLGLASGLASTGAHQFFKQLNVKSDAVSEEVEVKIKENPTEDSKKSADA